MRRKAIAMTIVGVSLSVGSAAHANEWLCDFENFTGSDGTAVANYIDILSDNNDLDYYSLVLAYCLLLHLK